ncbi:MAG TPA: hypothetical protein VLE89_06400 [Chlamydiales bacterium]|nr:hypothetical protein [Chlamydiales bacterium]
MNNCPHFSLCSGCELGENIFHPPIWDEIQDFFNHKITLIADQFAHTRYKAKLAVRPGPAIGLFKKNTHEVLSIPHCHTHHPAINRAVALIKQALAIHPIAPYQENPPSGLLRYIQLFVDRATHKIQLVLILNHQTHLQDFCRTLLQHDLWHSIWLNFHPDPTNRILGDQWQLIHGEPFLWQTLNNTPIAFHPGAFSQAHLPLFEKMIQKIATWIPPNEPLLELYAGVGAIALSLPNPATLIENNPFAHLSFLETLKQLPQHEQKRYTYHCINANCAPIPDNSLILVDPPRKGLEKTILEKLCALTHSRLIYISCGFESFKRDCERLQKAGWTIQDTQAYLLFPGTNHVEIVALLQKV